MAIFRLAPLDANVHGPLRLACAKATYPSGFQSRLSGDALQGRQHLPGRGRPTELLGAPAHQIAR